MWLGGLRQGRAWQGRDGATHRNRLMPRRLQTKNKFPGKTRVQFFSRRKQNAVDDVDYPGRAPSITSESVSVAVALSVSVSDSDSVSVSFAANSH